MLIFNFVVSSVFVASCSALWPSTPDGEVIPVPPNFDCAMRWLAYDYGQKLAVCPLFFLLLSLSPLSPLFTSVHDA